LNILITGGTGFIGMNLTEKFLTEGHNVIIGARKPLSDKAKKVLDGYNSDYFYEELNIENIEEIIKILDTYNIDSIIHTAAITPDQDRENMHSKKVISVNLMGTVNLLEEIKQRKIGRFIYTSSASVYGDVPQKNQWLYEDLNRTYPNPKQLYGITKLTAEKIALRYKELYDLDIVITRIGSAFGPWERYTGVRDTMSAPFAATRLALINKRGYLPREGTRDWVYSRDIANSIYKILIHKNPKHNIYNLSSGYIWSAENWCKKLQMKYPNFEFEFQNNPIVDGYISLHTNEDRKPLSIDRLVDDIGYTPIYNIEQAFDDYMEWIETINKGLIFGI